MSGPKVSVIWLLRHAEASDDAPDDASRKLTGRGRRQSELAAAAIDRLGIELDACLTSPKLRARQTAEIVCDRLGVELEQTEALRGAGFEIADLAAGRGALLLVGHEPDFSRAIALATGGRVRLRKAGLAAVEGAELRALMTPAELARIAGEDPV